jgi:uncharacterized protein (DUF885 family)
MNYLRVRGALRVLAIGLLAGCASTIPASHVARSSDVEVADEAEMHRAHALFDAYWDETARTFPEWATYRGDHRFGDRLRDASPEGIAAEDGYWRMLQQRLQSLDLTRLSATDRVSAGVLKHEADTNVLLQQFDGYRTMTVNASPFPFQAEFADLLRAAPVATVAQVEQLLSRMAAYPRRVEQEIARLKVGMKAGWVPPRPGLERVLAQLDVVLAESMEKSPLFEPFTRLGEAIAPAQKEALRARGARAVSEQALPAVQRLRDFVATQYLPTAPSDGALLHYPGGDQVYAALVRMHTTTSMTPRQIHELGLVKVAALRAEMESIMRSTGFQGDFTAFMRFLNSDPRFFYGSGEELLAGYRDIAKRIDPELPQLFAELPRAPYGIRAIPAFKGPEATETSVPPSLDGTRAGWFNANAARFKTRAKWEMETLTAHETVPGHQLQFARAAELKSLPAFRRDAFYTAYAEGWALYAETLGDQLGLYKDPYSRFGHLQAQIWRAARLVVDTGIHAYGWSRPQAIDYMAERTGLTTERVSGEVDRYTAWPGQALAYMIGQLKFIELRDRANAALGDRFDLRLFHMVVLDSGSVPLDVLEQQVDEWIALVKAGSSRATGPR